MSTPGAAMDRRIERPRTDRRWRWVAAAVGLLALLVLGWRLIPSSGSTDVSAADIETGNVARNRFEDYLPVRATVAPNITTFVGAVSGGQVEKLLVQDGTAVTEGQPIATLINPALKLDVLTREAEIASQLGTLSGDDLALEKSRLDRASQTSSASYDLIKANRDLSIRQQLHDQGFVSDEGVKSYREEADYQQKRLAQLRSGQSREDKTANLQASRLAETRARLTSNLAAVQAGLDALIVRAPVTGRLTNFTIQPGQMLKAGDPVGQVDSEGSWKLVADVDEYYLGRVAVGQRASGDNGLTLTVTKVLPAVTNGRFRIELGFVGPPPKGLNRGQTTDIRVTLGSAREALTAPVGGWVDSGGGNSAYVIDADGRHARRRAIRTGARNPEQVEILSGLAPGDRIVTSNTAAYDKSGTLNIR
ncbi:efflux RND transporter periplasmic adaptor subunit [Sphingomonas oryzagri]|uniref:Efflux RND transporter periplasmic adaptor subunit n=1 Tax=Sphingomonas oryzagri TaxID=3042314 RepID=A0ABT6MWX3_9SPHN|nr:efflux RND transporter periplasmic adaptor subunit [Sphingomonas oryzagri]MDH7637555.1 efflux RND transporter periplasmic adaptor subunit [Sphingomonas oryzagri]